MPRARTSSWGIPACAPGGPGEPPASAGDGATIFEGEAGQGGDAPGADDQAVEARACAAHLGADGAGAGRGGSGRGAEGGRCRGRTIIAGCTASKGWGAACWAWGERVRRGKCGTPYNPLFTGKGPDCTLTQVVAQAPAGSSVCGKRPRPPTPGEQEEENNRRLNLATALPRDVWQEHVRPLLPVREAAQLRGVCKALKEPVVSLAMDLSSGSMALTVTTPRELKAALTCFPATKSLDTCFSESLSPAEKSWVVKLLRAHGGTLRRVNGSPQRLSSAVRRGALPNLHYFRFKLEDPTHRQILSGGMLRFLEDVDVSINAEHLAALEHLRHLPHLRRLAMWGDGAENAAFPPFIPLSLKSLTLMIGPVGLLKSLLHEMPSRLEASGAELEEIVLSCKEDLSAEGGAVIGQVLRACKSKGKSALKTVRLLGAPDRLGAACNRALAPGLVECAQLEVLHCPWDVFSALPATGPVGEGVEPVFPSLIELCLEGCDGENLDLASPAWDIVANGHLPALTTLNVKTARGFSVGGPGEGGGASAESGRLARAFEAVGSTIMSLRLYDMGVNGLPLVARYELGAAIGKLRRLRHLELELFTYGWDYMAVGQGMAASGGCPELFKVEIHGVQQTVDWLTHAPSLIVPSVRDLHISGTSTEDEALLLCCGLVQMGYKYRLSDCLLSFTSDRLGLPPPTRACMRAILSTPPPVRHARWVCCAADDDGLCHWYRLSGVVLVRGISLTADGFDARHCNPCLHF
jgi:hypothetical protein